MKTEVFKMWYMKPPSSVKMVVHSRVMSLTQRMSDYPMSGKSVGLEEDLHRIHERSRRVGVWRCTSS